MAKKNYNLLIGVGALVGVVLLIALVGYLVSKPRPRVIQGEAEATEYRISCMVPGHVTELYCREGQQVHKGDTVAFIDSPQVRAKLAQAQAARSAAQAQSAKARNGARKEQIAGAYELWQQALVQEDVMKKSFERVKTLYDQKVISAQKYDETKAQYDAAVAQAKAAKSQYDMALDGARAEDRAAAAALVHQAEVLDLSHRIGRVRRQIIGEIMGRGKSRLVFRVIHLYDTMQDKLGDFPVTLHDKTEMLAPGSRDVHRQDGQTGSRDVTDLPPDGTVIADFQVIVISGRIGAPLVTTVTAPQRQGPDQLRPVEGILDPAGPVISGLEFLSIREIAIGEL